MMKINGIFVDNFMIMLLLRIGMIIFHQIIFFNFQYLDFTVEKQKNLFNRLTVLQILRLGLDQGRCFLEMEYNRLRD